MINVSMLRQLEQLTRIKKSLETSDLETARNRAEEKVLETLQDISVGKQIFGITLGELVEKYLDYKKDVLLNKEKKRQEEITIERIHLHNVQ